TERSAESLRREAQVDAREKAHAIVSEAEDRARVRQQEIVALEQTLADRTRTLADRISAADARDRELRGRESALADLRQRTETAAARTEQLAAERERELQRIARLTADEARELVLKDIEADARR